jgi:glycosyltransferase involved in cell wall biosynthesis
MVVMELHGSGIVQYTTLLADTLSKIIHVTMIVPEDSDYPFLPSSLRVIKLPMGSTKSNFIKNTLNFEHIINFLETILAEEPDIVHFRNPYAVWSAPVLPFMRQHHGIISGLPDGQFLPGQLRPDIVLSRKLHIKYSHSITVECEYDKALVRLQGIKKPCFVIPHGVNTLYDQYSKPGIEEANQILFFGGLPNEYKGLPYLLRAIPMINRALPELKIVVAGSGNVSGFEHLIANCKNLEIINRFIPHRHVPELFQRSAAIIVPYVWRVNSGIIPLAYSFRKPVVATTVLSDMVDPEVTGLIVPPRDESALAQAIIRIMKDEELRQQMRYGIEQYVKNNMNWDVIGKQALKTYEFTAALLHR